MSGLTYSRRGVLATMAACGSSPGRLAAFTPPPARFPLRISRNRRHLEDASGHPILIHGDTAWSLIAQLRLEDAQDYLRDRQARGFNAILVNLLEYRFASQAPANIAGDPPFRSPGDFASPNEAYFAHADRVLALAAQLGFIVLLAPAYLGYGGGSEGWYRPMLAAGEDRLRSYGAFVGRRYGRLGNLLWVHGGDYTPTDRRPVRAVVEGIRAHDRLSLHTAHCAPETAAAEAWADEPWLDLDTVYTYRPVADAAAKAHARRPHRPFILIESTYENEHGVGVSRLRTQAYQALLGGACGHVFGNNPIWHFDTPGAREAPVDWRRALGGAGTQSMEKLLALFSRLRWWEFAPDTRGALMPAPAGRGHLRQTAALRQDQRQALVHFPTPQPALLDMTAMASPAVTLRWFDPGSGRSVASYTARPVARGRMHVIPPGRDRPGGGDWILELTCDAG